MKVDFDKIRQEMEDSYEKMTDEEEGSDIEELFQSIRAIAIGASIDVLEKYHQQLCEDQ